MQLCPSITPSPLLKILVLLTPHHNISTTAGAAGGGGGGGGGGEEEEEEEEDNALQFIAQHMDPASTTDTVWFRIASLSRIQAFVAITVHRARTTGRWSALIALKHMAAFL